jgi:hypothetical protein
MKRKAGILFAAVAAILLSAFLLMPRVVFVFDGIYATTQWKAEGAATRWMLLRHGYLATTIVADPVPPSRDLLGSVLSRRRTKAVVFSPYLSAIETVSRQSEGGPALVGMGPLAAEQPMFDVVLVASDGAGWDDAARFAVQRREQTRLPAAVVYQEGTEQSEEAARLFSSAFDDDSLVMVSQHEGEGGRSVASSRLDILEQHKAMLVAAPPLEQFEAYFEKDNGLQWIVDVRYASVVPLSQLAAVVADDLASSLEPVVRTLGDREERMTLLPLVRTCYPASGTLRSFLGSAWQAFRRSLL